MHTSPHIDSPYYALVGDEVDLPTARMIVSLDGWTGSQASATYRWAAAWDTDAADSDRDLLLACADELQAAIEKIEADPNSQVELESEYEMALIEAMMAHVAIMARVAELPEDEDA